MTPDQIGIFGILAVTMALFAWGQWRYDVVALMALLASVLAGVVSPEAAFRGFGHPAVITVASVLAISRALNRSGLIDAVAERLFAVARGPGGQQVLTWSMGAVLSGFMNNVGALTLLMPVSLSAARRFGYAASRVLMPLSFATILGGLITLIGTPPNIIVAGFRESYMGRPFEMFDFAPVGLAVAGAGLVYLLTVGWRLIPRHRKGRPEPEDLFEIGHYISEVRITDRSELVGRPARELEELSEEAIRVLGIIRGSRRLARNLLKELLQADDIVLVQAPSAALKDLTEAKGIELAGGEQLAEDLKKADAAVMEAVVGPQGRIVGSTPISLRLRSRYGVNLLAVAREGEPFMARIANVRIRPGDVLLLEGRAETMAEVVTSLGCLPLAGRGLVFQPRRAFLPALIFGAAIAAAALGWLPAAVALALAVLVMVLAGLLPARELYEAIDWPVLVLLGAMIPVGGALLDTGATAVIARWVGALAGDWPPWAILALLLVVTMTLSDIMNNAATAVVMAPVAVGLAAAMGVSADPLLMAVAVGASCAFLTPIGHQNNTLVMGPGGYRFTDYWKVGLPLEIIILCVAVPLIPMVWPF